MIDVIPDAVPTLGGDERISGLYIATGLSGHGFGIGPAVGRIMADLPISRPVRHDLKRFRPNRFFDGSEIVPEPFSISGGRTCLGWNCRRLAKFDARDECRGLGGRPAASRGAESAYCRSTG